VTIPGFQDVMLPLLRQVVAGGEARTGDLVQRMEREFELTVDERAKLLPSGNQTVMANRTHWAITYLAKTGLLERTRRGHVRAADRGRSVLAEPPARLDLKYLGRFPELDAFQAARRIANGEDEAESARAVEESSATPDEMMRSAYARVDAALRELLLNRVLSSPPAFFERVIVRLLIAMGFGGGAPEAGRALGRSGDGGVDGVSDQNALGLDRVYVQAKRYATDNAVGPAARHAFSEAWTHSRRAREFL
jgi:restriction system protein